ncbi:SLC13 family permease [Candidatus Nitrospira bockiana]
MAGPEEVESRTRWGWVALVAGPTASVVFSLLPVPLAPEAHALAAILLCVVVYWIAEPIPLPMTALLGTAACVLTGLASAKTAFAAYGHPIIFLFIGSFLLAEAMAVHGVDRKVAGWALSLPWVAERPSRLLLALGAATALISMWISNTAATALMLPIGLGLLSALESGAGAAHGGFQTGLMLMLSYASTAGGMATMLGTPPNLIGIGLIGQQTGVPISFVTWLGFGLPLGLLMLLTAWLVLIRLHPPARHTRVRPLPFGVVDRHWSRGQVSACFAFMLAVTLWVGSGLLSLVAGPRHPAVLWLDSRLPTELVALLAAGLLFILPADPRGTPTLTWKQASHINWGIIVLFGGGLAFGDLMIKTGLSDSVGEGFVELFGTTSLWGLTAVSIGAGVLISELASNTASATLLIPLVIAIAQAAGLPPVPPALGACLGASLGFALPVSTPPNAIVYGTSLVPMSRMIRAGLVFDLMGAVLVWIVLRVACPWLGLT